MLPLKLFCLQNDRIVQNALRLSFYTTTGPVKESVSSPSGHGRTQFHKFRQWKKQKESQEKMDHFKKIVEHAFAKTPSRFQLVDVKREREPSQPSPPCSTSQAPLSVLALSKEIKGAMAAMKISVPTEIQVSQQAPLCSSRHIHMHALPLWWPIHVYINIHAFGTLETGHPSATLPSVSDDSSWNWQVVYDWRTVEWILFLTPPFWFGDTPLLGSGKTLAYLLPLVHRLKMEEQSLKPPAVHMAPRAVILVPSRELVQQTLVSAPCHGPAPFLTAIFLLTCLEGCQDTMSTCQTQGRHHFTWHDRAWDQRDEQWAFWYTCHSAFHFHRTFGKEK